MAQTARKSRASRAAEQAEHEALAAAEANAAKANAAPDEEQPQAEAQEQPKAEAEDKPKAQPKPKLGPSGYRERYGTSDAELVSAVRRHAEANEVAAVAELSDEQIVEMIGWSYTAASAIRKVGAKVEAPE